LKTIVIKTKYITVRIDKKVLGWRKRARIRRLLKIEVEKREERILKESWEKVREMVLFGFTEIEGVNDKRE